MMGRNLRFPQLGIRPTETRMFPREQAWRRAFAMASEGRVGGHDPCRTMRKGTFHSGSRSNIARAVSRTV